MKKIIAFILGLILLFLPFQSFAESNFTTDYNVIYNVMENALTHVTFNISLTNKTSQYYASSYNIQVGFKDIENVLIRDSGGKITPKISNNNDGSNIEIVFNDKSVGLGQKLNFTISFDTKDISQKYGKIWDINIPGLAEQKAYNSFNVTVIVPKFLGNPSYVKPDTGRVIDGNLNFSKEELGESGISISFGKEQIYDFNLSYHLKNSNLFPVRTEIALPSSTNYQDVQISRIDPKPQNVIRDVDGNWLAQYILTPNKKVDIGVEGKAKITLKPKIEPMTDTELKEYTKNQPYWQTDKKEIKDLALRLKTPYAIYQYVVDNLTYDFAKAQENRPRVGAYGVLKNPSSTVCLEFTDLFIAIARAAGIPTREMNGFASTSNSKERPLSLVKDILHAWPEYYDYELQTWIMIDPTWSNTTGGVDYFHTLDFDHFAFITKGASSTYPIPAGGYKLSDNNATKDIFVKFGNDFFQQIPILTLNADLVSSYFSGLNPQGNIVIKNDGQAMSLPQEITITTTFLKPRLQRIYIDSIPPFGFLKIPISFQKPPLLTNRTETIKIAIGENYILKDVRISLFILNKWTILGGIIFVSIILTISYAIYKARNLSLFRRRK
jgi:hypothetical protein